MASHSRCTSALTFEIACADGVEPSTYTLNAAIDVCAKAADGAGGGSGGGASLSACLEEALRLFSYLQGGANSQKSVS